MPDDTNGLADVFVHDRQTGQTTRVSVDSNGTEFSLDSNFPHISGDGRYVAFTAGSIFPPVDWMVIVHDRGTGVTQTVSVDSAGIPGNASSGDPYISADGRFVAFFSEATNLVLGDTNATNDIFVHDVGDLDGDGEWDPFDPDVDGDGAADAAEGFCGDALDNDGNGLVNDGCPQIGATAETGVECTNATDDDGDGFINDGCPGSTETNACGSKRLDAASRPERLEAGFAGEDDDGDTLVDEPLPADSEGYDCDGDGFVGSAEMFVFSAADTTDDQAACAETPDPDDELNDRWPPDFDDNQTVNILDFLQLTPPVFNSSPPNPNYSQRKDLNADGSINILDFLRLTPPVFNTSCAP